ncbi:uncharacterized protein [Oryza sativa Japonica Group]|uniref:uncharacterized protein isoform X2 n=1 Tax=Oryza sativa subsp. japonica TaxID=39947 RepID=UPI00077540E0|nr:uncharacterized protein LOC9266799 isoform X2 [Oryza sativa Japonica Group]
MRTSPDVSSFSGHRSATAEELMSTDTREQEITWLARSCSSSGSDPNKKKSENSGLTLQTEESAFEKLVSKPHAASIAQSEPGGEDHGFAADYVTFREDTASVLLETITYIKFLHGTDAGAESTAFLDGGSIEEAPCISARLPSWERSGI